MVFLRQQVDFIKVEHVTNHPAAASFSAIVRSIDEVQRMGANE